MEEKITKDVQERLDKINWESLKEKYGISKETIMKSPAVAAQLAYGQMTDLVPANTKEMNAMFSLRAYPDASGEMVVKLFSMEKPKTQNDTLYLYNHPIISDKIKEALLERTTWEDGDHNKRHGMANANGGRPISIELDGKKQDFLVSIHQPTNRVIGMPVEQVKSYLMDKDGHSRGRGIYGVSFTDGQARALSEGASVVINGRRKNGETFVCCVQFDAAQRQVVPCHPTWFKQAQMAGLGISGGAERQQEQVQEQKQEEQPAKARSMKR